MVKRVAKDLIEEHCGGGKKKGAKKKGKDCAKDKPGGSGSAANCNKPETPACKFKRLKNRKLVLKLNCKYYPRNEYPFFIMTKKPGGPCNNEWAIRPSRPPVKTDVYYELFKQRIVTNSPKFLNHEIQILRRALNPPGHDKHNSTLTKFVIDTVKDGRGFRITGRNIENKIIQRIEALNGGLYSGSATNKKINMHHLRPSWAMGEDVPGNLWPSVSLHQKIRSKKILNKDTSAGRRYNVISIHDWWNVRLQDAFKTFFERGAGYRAYKLYLQKKCYPPNGKNGKPPKPAIFSTRSAVNTYGENNISNILAYMQALKPPIKVVVSMKCSESCVKR